MAIVEIDGVIPESAISNCFQDKYLYKSKNPVWNEDVLYRLGKHGTPFGRLRYEDVFNGPYEDVFEGSKKVAVFGGEKNSVFYDPMRLGPEDIDIIRNYGENEIFQSSKVKRLASDVVKSNGIKEYDTIICQDHGLGAAIQAIASPPDSIVSFDCRRDDNNALKFFRYSWAHHLAESHISFGMGSKPYIVRASAELTKENMVDLEGKVAVMVDLNILNSKYSGATIESLHGDMSPEQITRSIRQIERSNDVVSLGIYNRWKVLDKDGTTSKAVEKIANGNTERGIVDVIVGSIEEVLQRRQA